MDEYDRVLADAQMARDAAVSAFQGVIEEAMIGAAQRGESTFGVDAGDRTDSVVNDALAKYHDQWEITRDNRSSYSGNNVYFVRR